MRSKKQLLQRANVYLILDRDVNSYTELFDIVKQALPAGVDIIQLRDKNGSPDDILHFSHEIKKLTKNRAPYIINDRVDLAIGGMATGVHLGQDDMPVKQARRHLGDDAIIGVSCQNMDHAVKAQEDGADYIGFGSIFKTLTKPDRHPMDLNTLEKVIATMRVPLFAIGGIQLENIEQLKAVGVHRVALCRAICQADDVCHTVEQFKDRLNETVATY